MEKQNFTRFTLSAFHYGTVYEVVSFDGEIVTGEYVSQQFMGARGFFDSSPGWKLSFKNDETDEIHEILYSNINLTRYKGE